METSIHSIDKYNPDHKRYLNFQKKQQIQEPKTLSIISSKHVFIYIQHISRILSEHKA